MTHQMASPNRMVRFAPQRRGQPAEEQGAAEGDELHHQDRGDQDRLGVAELLGAEDGGRGDDGLDAVVEEQVGEQEGERHRVAAHVAQRRRQLSEAAPQGVALDVLDVDRRVVLEPQVRDEGEAGPPRGRREHAQARGQALVEADRVAAEVDAEVDHEQEAATEVAEGPPARGDPVAVVLVRDQRQDRVVDHAGGAEEQVAEHDAHGGEQPVVTGREEDQRGEERARSTPASRAGASCWPPGRRTRPAAAGSPRTGWWTR